MRKLTLQKTQGKINGLSSELKAVADEYMEEGHNPKSALKYVYEPFKLDLQKEYQTVKIPVNHQEVDQFKDDTSGSISDILESYSFQEQLKYPQLSVLTSNKEKRWNKDEVTDLIKNDIITKAYIEGTTLTLVVNEAVISTVIFVRLSYGNDIDMDYSEAIISPENTFFYPNTILAYARTADNHLETLSKDGVTESSTHDKDFLDSLESTFSQKGAKKLKCILYSDNEVEKLLVDQKIRTVLK